MHAQHIISLYSCQAYSVSDETLSRQAGTEDGDEDAAAVAAAATAAAGGSASASGVTFEVSYSASTGWTPDVCEECMTAASDRADVERSVFQVKWGGVSRLMSRVP